MRKFLIGQRVVVGDEIGTVARAPERERKGCTWVYLPSRKHASQFADNNIQPFEELPVNLNVPALQVARVKEALKNFHEATHQDAYSDFVHAVEKALGS